MPTETPDGTRVPHPAQVLGEGLSGGSQLRVEDRHLDRSLGHRVADHVPQAVRDGLGCQVLDRGQRGR